MQINFFAMIVINIILCSTQIEAECNAYVFKGNEYAINTKTIQERAISNEERSVIVSHIIKNIAHVNDSVCREYLKVLEYFDICDDYTMPIYIKIINDKKRDVKIKWMVTEMLGKFGIRAKKAMPHLANVIRESKNSVDDWRDLAAIAIGNIGGAADKDTIDALVYGAENGLGFGSSCTSACVASLCKLGDEGYGGLLRLLSAEDSRVSDRAFAALLTLDASRRKLLEDSLGSLNGPRRDTYRSILEKSQHSQSSLGN